MGIKQTITKIVKQWVYVDDPSTFKTEYNDKEIDRERKKEKTSKWDKYNVFKIFVWYPSHYSSYEKKYLMKFDSTILLFLCFSFYTKYLDNANVASAYISGMKEDLKLHGNELNYFNTCYTVGYAVFQIPSTMLITNPMFARHWLLFCELAWGMMTLANAYVTNASQMYAIRFFIGVFEASSFPVTYMILSSYLTPSELFKRAGFYGAWASAGTASAGALQSLSRKHLDGVFGMAGWRWQFIIDAVITFGIFLMGFFCFPGTPTSCKEFGIFNEDDLIFARKRVENFVSVPKTWTKKAFIETVTTWQIYLCPLLWVLHHKTWYANSAQLYFKSLPQLYPNTEPTTWTAYTTIIGIPSAIIVPALCACYGKMIPINICYLTAYYASIIFVIWNVPEKVYLSALFIQWIFRSGAAQIFYAWFAVLCRDNVEKKALVLSFAQAFSYAVNAFSDPLQYNVKNGPRFQKGYIANLIIIILGQILFFIIWFLEKYDKKIIPRFAGHREDYDSENISDKKTININSVDEENYQKSEIKQQITELDDTSSYSLK